MGRPNPTAPVARTPSHRPTTRRATLVLGLDAGVQTVIDPGPDGLEGTGDDLECIPGEELTKVFDTNGNVKWATIYASNPTAGQLAWTGEMPFKIYSPIVHLAMQAHRKNRRQTDIGEASEFTVAWPFEIDATWNEQMLSPGREAFAEVLRMNVARWEELELKSKTEEMVDTECDLPDIFGQQYDLFPVTDPTSGLVPWSPSSVIGRFHLCVQRAIEWVDHVGD